MIKKCKQCETVKPIEEFTFRPAIGKYVGSYCQICFNERARLQGKDVCGLHVPWNLTVIPKKTNLQKNNKFDGTYYNRNWKNPEEANFSDWSRQYVNWIKGSLK